MHGKHSAKWMWRCFHIAFPMRGRPIPGPVPPDPHNYPSGINPVHRIGFHAFATASRVSPAHGGWHATVMHCTWCVHGETPPCSHPCEHTHRQGIVLACRPVPVLAFLNACMHPENFSVKILKCRKKVEFTKSSHLLAGGSTFSRIHGSVLSFFPLAAVARRSNLEDRIPGRSRIGHP